MLLAIDAGNTSITAGCLEDGKLLCKVQFSSERRSADELAVLISSALRMRGMDTTSFEGAAMAWRRAAAARGAQGGGVSGHRLCPACRRCGRQDRAEYRHRRPVHAGADLVASAVAALAGRTPPVIITDLGTATTIYVIDERSRLLAGPSCPERRCRSRRWPARPRSCRA